MPRSVFRRLWADRRGIVGFYFMMTAVGVIFMMFASLDFLRMSMLRSQAQSAVDFAVLAAGRNLGADPKVWQQEAMSYFQLNLGKNYLNSTAAEPVFTTWVTADGANHASISLKVTAPLMSMALLNTPLNIEIEANAQARQRTHRNVEMVMALDNTGSMAGSKLTAMKNAALDVVSTLLGQDTSGGNTTVGLVPFTETVRVGNTALTRSWLDTSKSPFYDQSTWQGCLMERPNSSGRYYFDTRTPTQAKFPAYADTYVLANAVVTAHTQNIDYALSRQGLSLGSQDGCTTAPLKFLSANSGELNAAIKAMTANGSTMLAPGLTWSWRMLTPSWRSKTSGWGDADRPADYAPDLTKVVVLLTDGDNEVMEFYYSHLYAGMTDLGSLHVHRNPYGDARNVNPWGYLVGKNNLNADNLVWNNNVLTDPSGFSSICSAMKGDGITVFTIAFGSGVSGNTKTILSKCASDPTYFMVAPSSTDLKEAFNKIVATFSENVIEPYAPPSN